MDRNRISRTLAETTQLEWISRRRWDDVRESTRDLDSAMLSATGAAAQSMGVTVMG